MTNQDKEIISKIVYQSYYNIDFINRFKEGSSKFNFPPNSIMKKMDKKKNLDILSQLGYNFKLSSPGQYYSYLEQTGNIKLNLFCQISGGIITEYIYIYIDNEKLDVNYYRSNLAFTYRYLINDMNAEISALTFRNFEDFKEAMKMIISIYEDFKKEFITQMKAKGLLANN